MITVLYIIGLLFAAYGLVAAGAKILEVIEKYIPYLRQLKAATWNKLADTVKVRGLEKKAIASNIEFALNRSVQDLQSELPSDWIRWAKVKWVKKNASSELEDNELILHIRPENDDERNYLNAVYYFFSTSIFPKTQRIVPPNVKNAVSLYLTKRTLESNQPYLKQKFDHHFVEKHEDDDLSVAGYLGDFIKIDEHGFFNSTFIREVDTLADSLRFSHERSNIEIEIRSILDHLKMFSLRGFREQRDWYRTLSATSYGFILVARSEKARAGPDPYIHRARQRQRSGIRRLYLLGRREERDFFVKVATEIMNLTVYTVTETFGLFRDYRGDPSGIGVLLIADEGKLLSAANLDFLLGPGEEDSWNEKGEGKDKKEHEKEKEEEEEEEKQLQGGAGVVEKVPAHAHITIESSVIATEAELKIQIRDLCFRFGDPKGSILLSKLGSHLRQQIPLFNASHYGFKSLIPLLKHLGDFDINVLGPGGGRDMVTPRPPPDQTSDLNLSAFGPTSMTALVGYLKSVVSGLADQDGWVDLSYVSNKIRTDYPQFSLERYECRKLSQLFEKTGAFYLEREETALFPKSFVKIR